MLPQPLIKNKPTAPSLISFASRNHTERRRFFFLLLLSSFLIRLNLCSTLLAGRPISRRSVSARPGFLLAGNNPPASYLSAISLLLSIILFVCKLGWIYPRIEWNLCKKIDNAFTHLIVRFSVDSNFWCLDVKIWYMIWLVTVISSW